MFGLFHAGNRLFEGNPEFLQNKGSVRKLCCNHAVSVILSLGEGSEYASKTIDMLTFTDASYRQHDRDSIKNAL